MNDGRLDDRIRELYAELAEAAPEAPPMPSPGPARRPVWARPVALAAARLAVVAVLVGVAAVFLTQLDGGDDEATAPAATEAPAATVGAPRETFAPATTAAGAADGVDREGTTPPDERIILLANLNRACTAAIDRIESQLPAELDTEEDFQIVFTALLEEFEALRRIVEEANADREDDELAMISAEIMGLEAVVIMGGDEPLRSRYPDGVAAANELGALLAEFGATDCSDLGVGLP